MAKKLTDKQQRFIDEYLIDLNATQAAIRAGYAGNSAKEIAYENLTKPHIAEEIDRRRHERSKMLEVDAVWVLERLIGVHDRCIQAEAVLDSRGEPTGEYRFDSSGANKALDLIGKHIGMFGPKGTQDDPVHHQHSVTNWHAEKESRLKKALGLMKK